MNKRWILLGLVGVLVLSAVVYAAAGAGLLSGTVEPVADGMPVPGADDVPEMVVDSEVPVPGYEDVPEMIVGSEMPVPGLEGMEESIVISD